jgi:hypothetical protein
MVRPDIAMARDEVGETLDADARRLNANPEQRAARQGGTESAARSNALFDHLGSSVIGFPCRLRPRVARAWEKVARMVS